MQDIHFLLQLLVLKVNISSFFVINSLNSCLFVSFLLFFFILIFSGELVQIKYALNAVAAGSTAVGIKGILFF